jgi:lipopolysaccharide/colanic/teichoic acid biosynthesis glycosyltransferase
MSGDPASSTPISAHGSIALVGGLAARRDRDAGTGEGSVPVEVCTVATSRLTEGAIRLLDILGAIALLVLLSPFLLLVAIVVRLDSPGPAIFRQRRLGKDLAPFSVAKFRTMRTGAGTEAHRSHVERMIAGSEDRGTRPMQKLEEDARVTRSGAFLRRTSIDELPQLWNVLRGEMSLVGPRPPIQYEVDRYPPEAFRRFAVRPGMTGLWQVSGRSLLTFQEMIERDTEYVETRSLGQNLKILLLTLPTVIHGKGAA